MSIGKWKGDIKDNIKYIIMVSINRYLLWLCLYMELSILSFKKIYDVAKL